MCMCGNRTCMGAEQEQGQILVYIMAATQCLWKADTETASCSAKDYNLSIQIPPPNIHAGVIQKALFA